MIFCWYVTLCHDDFYSRSITFDRDLFGVDNLDFDFTVAPLLSSSVIGNHLHATSTISFLPKRTLDHGLQKAWDCVNSQPPVALAS